MVLLIVVGVVNQDVEHHSAEQLVGIGQMRIALGDADSAKDSGQLRVAHFWLGSCWSGRSDSGASRDAVNPPTRHPIESPNGQGVGRQQVNNLGLGDGDTGLRRQRQGRVLDERSVNVLVLEELDDPLLALDFDQSLGLVPTVAWGRLFWGGRWWVRS